MGWLGRWRNSRVVRRFGGIHLRDLCAAELARVGWRAGRADELDRIARLYAREARVFGYSAAVVDAGPRRTAALIRAGQRNQLTGLECADGEMRRTRWEGDVNG